MRLSEYDAQRLRELANEFRDALQDRTAAGESMKIARQETYPHGQQEFADASAAWSAADERTELAKGSCMHFVTSFVLGDGWFEEMVAAAAARAHSSLTAEEATCAR